MYFLNVLVLDRRTHASLVAQDVCFSVVGMSWHRPVMYIEMNWKRLGAPSEMAEVVEYMVGRTGNCRVYCPGARSEVLARQHSWVLRAQDSKQES
jgi:hypothetical protein